MIGMRHTGNNLFKGDIPVAVLCKQHLIRLVGKLADAVVHAGRIILVRIQPVDLALQFFRINPIIVTFAQSDIFPACCREKHQVVDIHPAGIEVLFLVKRTDDFRVFLRVLLQNLSRSVGRRVVVDEHFKGEVRFLCQKAVQRFTQEVLVVKSRAQHGHLARRCIGCILFFSLCTFFSHVLLLLCFQDSLLYFPFSFTTSQMGGTAALLLCNTLGRYTRTN